MSGFKNLFDEVERLLEDPEYGSLSDTLSTARLKILAAGLKAADTMMDYPELAEACIPILISHMEVYAELVIVSQSNDVNIPKQEESLAMLINNSTVMGES